MAILQHFSSSYGFIIIWNFFEEKFMEKKLLLRLLSPVCAVVCAFGIVGCGHSHTFSDE